MSEQKKEEKQPPNKVGYTWYPKDWQTSETFFDVDDLTIRYLYREVIDLMNMSSGFWKENRGYLEKLERYKLTDEMWSALRSLFVVQESEGVAVWTHDSVTKRLGRSSAQQAQALANLDRINTKKQKPNTGDSPENSPEDIDRSTEAHRPFKKNIIEDKETKPNKGLVSSISTTVVNSDPLHLSGVRVELQGFEQMHGKFGKESRSKALKLWKKLNLQETRNAARYWLAWRGNNPGKGFSEYVKTKWWNLYIESSKSPQA